MHIIESSTTRTAATTDVVIVNWNAGPWLHRCVSSIRDHGIDDIGTVTIVDNGSTDGSDRLKFNDFTLDIVRTGENLGFGRACNRGARRGKSPYILFLNPDAALLQDTLKTALDFLDRPENAKIGVCGIKLIEEDGSVQRHCARLPSFGVFLAAASGLSALFPRHMPALHDRGFDHLTNREVDHVIGAFYLIRRDLFEKIGGFDDQFFVYLEDLDLSARVHGAGFKVYYLADAVGFHKGGGTSDQIKPQRLAYALEGRILYAFKHFNLPAAVIVTAATLLIEPFPRIIKALMHFSAQEIRDTLLGFSLLWRRVAKRAMAYQSRSVKIQSAKNK